MRHLYFFLVLLLLLYTKPGGQIMASQPAPENMGQDFLELLAEGDFKAAVSKFDKTMANALPQENLARFWEKLTQQNGEFEDVIDSKQHLVDGYQTFIITTKFAQATLDVKVVFSKQNKVAGLFFSPTAGAEPDNGKWTPPAYRKPNSHREVDITIGRGKWALPATLTLPASKPPFPLVILVHGSGPNDRDETVGPNKPFKDIAWGLSSHGIATLRYEKRTRQYASTLTPEDVYHMTLKEETVDDAVEAVKLAKRLRSIDSRKIFVAGHSLGGMCIPLIASRVNVSGYIILAGNIRPLEELLQEQYRYIFSLDSVISPEEEAELKKLEEQIAYLRSGKVTPSTDTDLLPLSLPGTYWLHLLSYKPASLAKNIKSPVLILQGGRDYQVTAKDLEGWKKALPENPKTLFKLYPDLNHLFMKGEGPCTPSEYTIQSNVDEEVITDIISFIHKVHP